MSEHEQFSKRPAGHTDGSGTELQTPTEFTTCAMDVGRLLEEGRWTGYLKFLVALVALAIIFDGAEIQLLALAVPSLMDQWAVPRGAFAPVFAVGLVGMMIGGALGGYLGDRFGRKTALIGSVFTFGAMTLAIA